MSKKQRRRRRSFYQPESDILTKWLDEQDNLGRSLQLVIIDAIRNYGEGDVITAFLDKRGQLIDDGAIVKPEQQEMPKTSKPKKQTAVEPVAKKTEPRQVEPVREDAEQPVEREQDDKRPIPNRLKQDTERVLPTRQSPEQKSEDGDTYDPIAVMMQDIGSSLK